MPVAPENWVWLARIRRPQGRKGEVLAEILTDFPEKFAERRQVWLLPASVGAPGPSHPGTGEIKPIASSARPIDLSNHWLHKGGIVLHFAGVDSISAAEELKGMVVAVPQAARAPLAADETYIGDLIGCVLVDVAGAEAVTVGEIENVDRSGGAAPLLVVRSARGEVLVPFAKSYLRRIDLAGKRVEMALPEGLVDLNAPGA
ncbi:MAG: ribosome maturation factor RimM [Terracidiphilus sp.]|nr:ribosome maturation factor RimM [Terracidiphilus sp.]MDR3798680.1 ribosome maturation factor RimM [Terracidiphilus sp.]